MFTFSNISDIATDPPFWKVFYRFSTDYYSTLPHLGNIRQKPRVTRHNLSLFSTAGAASSGSASLGRLRLFKHRGDGLVWSV